MISELQQLAKKVDQIALLIQTLRSENTHLRHQLTELTSTNAELKERIQEAHDRVTAVIDNVPQFTNPAVSEQEAV